MNLITDHLDKNNLHHAYLIEGAREEVIPEILNFLNEINIETTGNPDFSNISFDSFKIEDARNIKINSSEKGFSGNVTKGLAKKIYVISANSFLLEAQNTLLKMFEEPIENTHFFLIVPDVSVLLKTLVSRFYLIKFESNIENELKKAEKFISMSIKERLDFIKDLLVNEEEENVINLNTAKSKSLKFLNALEVSLHKRFISNKDPSIKKSFDFFNQIFKAREFIIQPGSSLKSLMESIALTIPIL